MQLSHPLAGYFQLQVEGASKFLRVEMGVETELDMKTALGVKMESGVKMVSGVETGWFVKTA